MPRISARPSLIGTSCKYLFLCSFCVGWIFLALLLRPEPQPVFLQCPKAVQSARGIYQDGNLHPEFKDTVLLVSLNYGYYDFLQNWEYLAAEHGLKWAVVAMDDKLFNKLGRDRAVQSDLQMTEESSTFREHHFNQISCNKMRVVLNIMEACHVNVVFSDVDNVFLKDPFQYEFGKMIASNQFDYIYQPNEWEKEVRTRRHSYESFLTGKPPPEANTGFYYLSRHSSMIKEVMTSVLKRCSRIYNSIDDQTLFWEEFHAKLRWRFPWVGTRYRVQHCTKKTLDTILDGGATTAAAEKRHNNDRIVQLCCMDPYDHPTGSETDFPIQNYEETVTYHANFAVGKKDKQDKLKRILPDNYAWDDSRVTDPVLENEKQTTA